MKAEKELDDLEQRVKKHRIEGAKLAERLASAVRIAIGDNIAHFTYRLLSIKYECFHPYDYEGLTPDSILEVKFFFRTVLRTDGYIPEDPEELCIYRPSPSWLKIANSIIENPKALKEYLSGKERGEKAKAILQRYGLKL